MKPESQAVHDARRRIQGAAAHMRDMGARFDGGAPFLIAVADMVEAVANRHHYGTGRSHRGILGGWAVRCSCGAGTWVELDGEPVPLCPALRQAVAVAEAYDPTGLTLRTDEAEAS